MAAAVLPRKNKKVGGWAGKRKFPRCLSKAMHFRIITPLQLQLFFSPIHNTHIYIHIQDQKKRAKK